MIKKVACFFVAVAATVGILFLVHAQVDSIHGPTQEDTGTQQTQGNDGY